MRHADVVRALTIGNRAVASRGSLSSLTEQKEEAMSVSQGRDKETVFKKLKNLMSCLVTRASCFFDNE